LIEVGVDADAIAEVRGHRRLDIVGGIP
jgi:hypothetical protein